MEKWADYLISAVRFSASGSHISMVRACVDLGEKVGTSTSDEQRGFVVDNIAWAERTPLLSGVRPRRVGPLGQKSR